MIRAVRRSRWAASARGMWRWVKAIKDRFAAKSGAVPTARPAPTRRGRNRGVDRQRRAMVSLRRLQPRTVDADRQHLCGGAQLLAAERLARHLDLFPFMARDARGDPQRFVDGGGAAVAHLE